MGTPWELKIGDSLETLKNMESGSVHCVVSSPPYWGLRDYGTGTWEGGDPDCSHKKAEGWSTAKSTLSGQGSKTHLGHQLEGYGSKCRKCGALRVDKQLGVEDTPEKYVSNILAVFMEVHRVLREDGTLWLNLGDTYNTRPASTGISFRRDRKKVMPVTRTLDGTLQQKNLIGIPWRVAFALQDSGWILRSEIIWVKSNPMPESVTDRPSKSHETIFLFSKSQQYYYDNEAIREPIAASSFVRVTQPNWENQEGSARAEAGGKINGNMKAIVRKSGNKARKPRPGAPDNHPGAQAGSIPWEGSTRNKRDVWTVSTKPFKDAHFAVFPIDLIEPCVLAGCPRDGVVLDPFAGSGTTGVAAMKHGRRFIGIELNEEYGKIAQKRLKDGAAQPTLDL